MNPIPFLCHFWSCILQAVLPAVGRGSGWPDREPYWWTSEPPFVHVMLKTEKIYHVHHHQKALFKVINLCALSYSICSPDHPSIWSKNMMRRLYFGTCGFLPLYSQTPNLFFYLSILLFEALATHAKSVNIIQKHSFINCLISKLKTRSSYWLVCKAHHMILSYFVTRDTTVQSDITSCTHVILYGNMWYYHTE